MSEEKYPYCTSANNLQFRLKPSQDLIIDVITIFDGLQNVCSQDNIHTASFLIHEILQGHLSLVLLEWRKPNLRWLYGGFIVTNLNITNQTEYQFTIVACYIEPLVFKKERIALEYWFMLLESSLRKVENPPKNIVFLSVRKGFKRRTKNMGFVPRLIEYVKEL